MRFTIVNWISSAPIVPIGPTTTDIHLDHNSSSMVNVVKFLLKDIFSMMIVCRWINLWLGMDLILK